MSCFGAEARAKLRLSLLMYSSIRGRARSALCFSKLECGYARMQQTSVLGSPLRPEMRTLETVHRWLWLLAFPADVMQPPPGGPVPCFAVGSDGLGEMLAPSKWRGVKPNKLWGRRSCRPTLKASKLLSPFWWLESYGRGLRWSRDKQLADFKGEAFREA